MREDPHFTYTLKDDTPIVVYGAGKITPAIKESRAQLDAWKPGHRLCCLKCKAKWRASHSALHRHHAYLFTKPTDPAKEVDRILCPECKGEHWIFVRKEADTANAVSDAPLEHWMAPFVLSKDSALRRVLSAEVAGDLPPGRYQLVRLD